MEIDMKPQYMQIVPHLFDIPKSVWETIELDAVSETFRDMVKVGIAVAPFYEFGVRFNVGDLYNRLTLAVEKTEGKSAVQDGVISPFMKDITICCLYKIKLLDMSNNAEDTFGSVYVFDKGNLIPFDLFFSHINDDINKIELCVTILETLIVLLCTKNTKRKSVINSPRANSKKARDDARSFSQTTYLSIGKITETYRSSSGSRGPVRAHLRRGHIRQQRIGEGRKDVKIVFIPPVFVNADREWIAERKQYRFSA